MAKDEMSRYSFQLLRYVPNLVSDEHFNIGVFLANDQGQVLDARFASDFQRLRCHPQVDLVYLETLRSEFEDVHVLGEGFSLYAEELRKNLSTTLQVTDPKAFWGRDAASEIERLYQAYVATPRPETGGAEEHEPAPGTRAHLVGRMESAFRRYGLVGNGRGLARNARVTYGAPGYRFTFDFAYPRNGTRKYLHGLALLHAETDAQKLRGVYQDLTRLEDSDVSLAVVVDDGVADQVVQYLEGEQITTHPATQLDALAQQIRTELGL